MFNGKFIWYNFAVMLNKSFATRALLFVFTAAFLLAPLFVADPADASWTVTRITSDGAASIFPSAPDFSKLSAFRPSLDHSFDFSATRQQRPKPPAFIP